jgi:CheY-like chemotaxis protein
MPGANILIVEDEHIIARELQTDLEEMGYAVTGIVNSGEKAIQHALEKKPDLVLMDIHLRTEMNGIEAASQIFTRFKIPVIFVSAFTDDTLIQRAKKVGSFGYLVKPYAKRELYACIEMAVYKAQAEKDRLNLERQAQRAQKMETVATLAGGIAHQFNNALFVITGNIELMEEDNLFDEKTAEKLRIMKDSAGRMVHLTRQLLAYSGGGKYQMRTVLLNALVKKTLPLVKYTLDSTVNADTDNYDRLHVEVYPAQIQLALSAVLTNASEAMLKGKRGHIRVDCRKVTLTEKDAGDFPGLCLGDYACLTITDDGCGMGEKTRAKIFEPFFTTKFQGRGMGMAAVHGIINNHSGRITVASDLGHHGTTVKIYLPTVAMPAPKQAPPALESLKGRGTILVIEDEKIVMAVNLAMLTSLGYRVLKAKTGQEAIDIAKTFDGRIDLATLDFILPDITGDELYPLLMEARPDLKVLVISGFAIDGPVKKIMGAGAQGFIQKPISRVKLAEHLKLILNDK